MHGRLFALPVAATLALLLAIPPSPEPADATHTWGNFHWARQSNPFTLQLGDNLNVTWSPYLRDASADWTRSGVLTTTIGPGAGGQCRLPRTGTVQVCNARYGINGWLGLAQIWADGDHITAGTVKLNDRTYAVRSR